MQYVALKQKGLKSILNPFGHFEKKNKRIIDTVLNFQPLATI